jgi:glucoamylase
MPERELFFGRPSGSAMPLVWAHAEHIKLLRSLGDGAVFDMPPQTLARYVRRQTPSTLRIWRFDNRLSTIPHGKILRLELGARAMVHWSADAWSEVMDLETRETAFGTHVADLDTARLEVGQSVVFTFLWLDKERWENADFQIRIGA